MDVATADATDHAIFRGKKTSSFSPHSVHHYRCTNPIRRCLSLPLLMPGWLLLLANELATASAASPRISFVLTAVVVVATLLLPLSALFLMLMLLLLFWLLTSLK